MSIVRMGRCASCGTPVLWLRAWGFGEPRPLELRPDPAGQVVIDRAEARHRVYSPEVDNGAHRYRLHWPCPSVTPTNGTQPNGTRTRPDTVTVGIVPHTHWDREWYSAFQTFRLRLVQVMDQILDVLDGDPSFAHFLLDGQTAMVDDYLEVRPEAERRIRRLAVAGRLSLGPWHTQPDQFLVSGETLVRNLQLGIARASELGGLMAVGYLPDCFGHIAQMPQLLRLAGIDHAVVFRGVPDAVSSTAFWWESPDGSRVRAEHLVLSYTNGFRLSEDPAALVARARDLEATLGDRLVGDLLVMNGGDHEPPRAWAGRVAREANVREAGVAGSYCFEITGLQRHLERQPVDGLPAWRGELRASGPSTVIMGVTSNRVDVKLAAAAAERAVERRAEPLSALLLSPADYPRRLLELAWRRLLDNAAHDSACACSSDEVVDQVLVRYHEARQIGEGLAAQAVAALARRVQAAAGSVLVVNARGHGRAGLVRFFVPGRGPLHLRGPSGQLLPAQILATRQAVELVAQAAGREIDVVLDLFGDGAFAGHPVARWETAPSGLGVVLEMAAPGEPRADLGDARVSVARVASDQPDGVVTVTLHQPPVRDVVACAATVPGFGWASHTVAEGDPPATGVEAGLDWVANEHLRVDADAVSGTLTVTTAEGLRIEGLNRYADGGDAGDTYNWSPPDDDRVVDRPDHVAVEVVERGPVRARFVVHAIYPWAATTEVRTTVDVVSGEAFVRVTTELTNTHPDHRLRVHFPLPAVVTGADAECAFAVVRRGLNHQGNPIEAGLPTYPARRFVDCSDGTAGLAIIHDGVAEYEVVEDGRELAFTLLRTVGSLSRDDGRLRPVGAGPAVAIPGAEQLGPFRRSYAIVVHRGGWADADLHARADDVLLPLDHTRVEGAGGSADLPASGSFLRVEGAEVTAVVRDGNAVVVRVVRAREDSGRVEVSWWGAPARGWTVDLRGRPLAPFDGGLDLGPWEIATLRLDGA